ncbi:MAG: hypothetical protein HQ481_15855 [Alphaproteobacteria bacterium]|nr:hypothetical protein [Alphaproteobacteria bacterium]
MRGRNQTPPPQPPSTVEYFAKEFAKFLNNVQNNEVDILGSFLIESEWENYRKNADGVIESLELAGFCIVPQMPTDPMVAAADKTLSQGLMGSGSRAYVSAVFGAMLQAWIETRDTNLILDIFSMALSRASTTSNRRDSSSFDSSFQRFRKQSQDILANLEKTGLAVVSDEPTPYMVSAGVSETAEHRSRTNQKIGADPIYITSLYENMIKARPK